MSTAIYFTDLALQYFPYSTKRSASSQLKRWISINRELKDKLLELHYQPYQRALTPLQHQAVVDCLGEP